MSKPTLLVVAGCNGSGKSTFSRLLVPARVAIRVQNGGHFVSESEIIKRYFEGFSNLDAHFQYFDIIDIFDTSAYSKEPEYILSIEKGAIAAKRKLPEYLMHLIPEIAKRSQ